MELSQALAQVLAVEPARVDAFIRFARGDSTAWADAPVATSTARPGNKHPTTGLPAPLTGLVGRKREIAAICELARADGVRLVTLSGPPGVGKTRLGLAAAEALATDFADGVVFVPLAPIQSPDQVPAAVAQVLDVRESRLDLITAIGQALRDKHLLLVLDNFEQVVAAGPMVTAILGQAPGVKALVTSRDILHLYGEHEFSVPALELPPVAPASKATSYVGRFEAVRLFRDRARAAVPGFALTADNVGQVARICAEVDGLPLAIELAAAQLRWMPLDRLVEQLGQRLAVLTGGPRDLTPRQQSLVGAIDWSYHLMAPGLQRLFAAAGVFHGSWDLDAYRAVADAVGLAPSPDSFDAQVFHLVDKSLLNREPGGIEPGRVSMLETLRDYARQHLSDEHGAAARAAHARHFRQWAGRINGDRSHPTWLETLGRDHHNLRAALDWHLERPELRQETTDFVSQLDGFWYMRGHFQEGHRATRAVLALNPDPTLDRARVLASLSNYLRMQGDLVGARAILEEAAIIQEGQLDEAGLCRTLETLAIVEGSAGDYAKAGALTERALVMRRRHGAPAALVPPLTNLALIRRRLGDVELAETLYREVEEICRALGDERSLSFALHGQGELCQERGDIATAQTFFREALRIRHRHHLQLQFCLTLEALSVTLLDDRRPGDAAKVVSATQRIRHELGIILPPAYQAEFEKMTVKLRAALGETAFSSAWEIGSGLSPEELLSLTGAADPT